MSARWAAGAVRSRGLLSRRLGRDRARRLAASASLTAAVTALGDTAYRERIRPGTDLTAAQRAVAAELLWQLRILAGWQPAAGARIIRCVAGWYEVDNIVGHARRLDGAPAAPPYELGALDTAWSRVAVTTGPATMRAALAGSAWGDPGRPDAELDTRLRLVWARRVAATAAETDAWAAGAAAVVLARQRFLAGTAAWIPAELLAGHRPDLSSWPAFTASLPPRAGWAVAGVAGPADLWRAEPAWWRRVELDAASLARRGRPGPDALVGTVALLAADARRVTAALELAARGGRPLEAFDAVV
ncbi:hypothetical protein Athai_09030 [Actinocatenispora thailandica]|uniref:V-type ATPase subunit n=1 Tax=Actinocatenispora thailandica TaxID=227318 RepID=A0A7R7DKG2_9ACTN|nr:hypothetical protein [Actinocatenispora thailandica]BCJ33400.1 hypothetical protein Athai_09030 [Actinocatenispora thailandica]